MNDMPDPRPPSPRKWSEVPVRLLMLRFALYTTLILLVCYGGLLVNSRTKGFACLCGDKVRDVVGLPVQVGRSSLDAALQLSLFDLSTTNDVARNGRFEADEVRLAWGPVAGIRSIEATGIRCDALFRSDKGWQPGLFSALGTSPIFGQLSRATAPQASAASEEDPDVLNREAEAMPETAPADIRQPPGYALQLKNLAIRFRTPEDETLARLDGATVVYEPASSRPDKAERFLLDGWFEWTARRRPRQEIKVEVLKTAEETRIIQMRVDADLLESIEQSLRSHLP